MAKVYGIYYHTDQGDRFKFADSQQKGKNESFKINGRCVCVTDLLEYFNKCEPKTEYTPETIPIDWVKNMCITKNMLLTKKNLLAKSKGEGGAFGSVFNF